MGTLVNIVIFSGQSFFGRKCPFLSGSIKQRWPFWTIQRFRPICAKNHNQIVLILSCAFLTVLLESLLNQKPKNLNRNPNPRAHYVLFDEDSPFKPKVVKRKDTYQRKPKHPLGEKDDYFE